MGIEQYKGATNREINMQYAERILESAVNKEGLFRPDGNYLTRSAETYLRRLEEGIEPLPAVNGLQRQQSEWIQSQTSKVLPVLNEEGWVGVARAHAVYTAFDAVRREAGQTGARGYLCIPHNGSNISNLEVLLTSPEEDQLLTDESRQTQIAVFKQSVKDNIIKLVETGQYI